MDLDTNLHSVFLLNYHLIMCIKCRNGVIDESISERLRNIFSYIAPKHKVILEVWEYDVDHVRVSFRAQPNTNLSQFINAYKSASSRLIKKEFPEIREKLWKEIFWSRSYCLLTTGGATIDVIRRYIETQGERNSDR